MPTSTGVLAPCVYLLTNSIEDLSLIFCEKLICEAMLSAKWPYQATFVSLPTGMFTAIRSQHDEPIRPV